MFLLMVGNHSVVPLLSSMTFRHLVHPLCHLLVALKLTAAEEVSKMLTQGAICYGSSPWSSLLVVVIKDNSSSSALITIS